MLRAVLLFLLFAALTPAADLSSFSWLAGRWVSDDPKAVAEEIWSPASGDGMIGMWRMVAGGKARVLEFMAIRQESDGIVLLLRHFDPALAVRTSEKERPLRFKLLPGAGKEWTFEGQESGVTVRLVYSRPDDSTLRVVLEKGEKKTAFQMRRAGS
jgi:hypothetical protein